MNDQLDRDAPNQGAAEVERDEASPGPKGFTWGDPEETAQSITGGGGCAEMWAPSGGGSRKDAGVHGDGLVSDAAAVSRNGEEKHGGLGWEEL